jgi:hypothetical protein
VDPDGRAKVGQAEAQLVDTVAVVVDLAEHPSV